MMAWYVPQQRRRAGFAALEESSRCPRLPVAGRGLPPSRAPRGRLSSGSPSVTAPVSTQTNRSRRYRSGVPAPGCRANRSPLWRLLRWSCVVFCSHALSISLGRPMSEEAFRARGSRLGRQR
jgi:hypothetical protein